MKLRLGLAVIFLLGSSCSLDTQETTNTTTSARPQIATPAVASVEIGGTWTALDEHISYMEYFFEKDNLSQLHLYRMKASEVTMRMEHNENEPQTITGWSKEFPDAELLFNGVFFSDDQFPSGYVALNGKQLGTRQFDLTSAGVITFDDEVQLLDGATDVLSLGIADNIAQNHPVLISHGEGAILSDDKEKGRRTFIGRDTHGYLYAGVVPRNTVTLYQLMEILQQMDINWDTVINLDGGSSTGLANHVGDSEQEFSSYVAVPNIFVIEEK